MEAAEHRRPYDPPEPLDRAMDWSVLAQRKMSTSLVAIRQVGCTLGRRCLDTVVLVFEKHAILCPCGKGLVWHVSNMARPSSVANLGRIRSRFRLTHYRAMRPRSKRGMARYPVDLSGVPFKKGSPAGRWFSVVGQAHVLGNGSGRDLESQPRQLAWILR